MNLLTTSAPYLIYFKMHNRKLTTIEKTAKKTGLFINPLKTKSMRINVNKHDKLQIFSTDIVDVQNFTYPTSSNRGGGAVGYRALAPQAEGWVLESQPRHT